MDRNRSGESCESQEARGEESGENSAADKVPYTPVWADEDPLRYAQQLRAFFSGESDELPVPNDVYGFHRNIERQVVGGLAEKSTLPPEIAERVVAFNKAKFGDVDSLKFFARLKEIEETEPE